MSDTFSAEAYSNTFYWESERSVRAPLGDYPGVYDYKFYTHDKWLLSAALILGKVALLSADYEISNYRHMSVYDIDGLAIKATNDEISNNFTTATTLRLGGELRITPQFAIRGGAALSNNPMQSILRDGRTEVYTVGTIPHYTLDNTVMSYSAGLGYRFTPNFYMDLACQVQSQEEKLYAFSNLFNSQYAFSNLFNSQVESKPGTLNSNATRMVLTLGYKF
jgi:long-subunit fatty acid transport protein